MQITRQIKAIVSGIIEAVSKEAGVVNSHGIDEQRWRRRVWRRMERDEPQAHAAVQGGAAEDWYALRIAEHIRRSRDSEVENLRDWEEQLARLRRGGADEVLRIRVGQNDYVAKRLRDCTTAECLAVGEQYMESSRDLARRGRFLVEVGRQMRLAGLADDDPLSVLLAA